MSDSDQVNVGAGSSSGVVRLEDLQTTVDALAAKALESQGTTGMCQNVYVSVRVFSLVIVAMG